MSDWLYCNYLLKSRPSIQYWLATRRTLILLVRPIFNAIKVENVLIATGQLHNALRFFGDRDNLLAVDLISVADRIAWRFKCSNMLCFVRVYLFSMLSVGDFFNIDRVRPHEFTKANRARTLDRLLVNRLVFFNLLSEKFFDFSLVITYGRRLLITLIFLLDEETAAIYKPHNYDEAERDHAYCEQEINSIVQAVTNVLVVALEHLMMVVCGIFDT